MEYARRLQTTLPSPPERVEESDDISRLGEGVCPLCRGLGRLRADVSIGHPGFGTLVPCQCQADEIRRREIARLSQVSGLLPEELALRLDDVAVEPRDAIVAKTLPAEELVERQDTVAMLELAHRFIEQPWGFLTLHGPYGNAKTLILQAVVNEFREQRGVTGTYVRMHDLLDYIRAGYASDTQNGARARYERLKSLPILAIDEFDAARMTDFAYEFRTAFLDDRYRLAATRRAHTLFAMNGNPAELPGDLYDRMRDGRFVIFRNADASMRPAMT